MKLDIEWGTVMVIDEGQSHIVHLDTTTLSITRKPKRWLIDHQNPSTDKLLIKGSTQKVYASNENKLLFIPALPADPVVLKPDEDIFLMPHQKMVLYVRVPVWMQIYSGIQKPEHLLTEIPVKVLSDIWFGEPQSGEKGSTLRFDESFLDRSKSDEFEIVCPVEIYNASDLQLPFHRFALRTRHLSIYSTPEGLMANETKIKYSSEEAVSNVVYVKKAPILKAVRICEPRESAPTKILGRSFSFANIIPVIS